ncbi:MAG TPA: hypothetical protein DER60_08185 [Syntrophomonas sp.]|nr:hypothetical protein [Syntrophomonas sp.]
MKLRNILSLPVFYEPTATVIGSVKEVVVDDSYRIDYLIINTNESEVRMIPSPCFVLGQHAVLIHDMASIKPCPAREESTVYEKKVGDVIYDEQGREVGAVSDFIISAQDHRVWGVEVYSGALNDILQGRCEIPLDQVTWKSITSAVIESERRA